MRGHKKERQKKKKKERKRYSYILDWWRQRLLAMTENHFWDI